MNRNQSDKHSRIPSLKGSFVKTPLSAWLSLGRAEARRAGASHPQAVCSAPTSGPPGALQGRERTRKANRSPATQYARAVTRSWHDPKSVVGARAQLSTQARIPRDPVGSDNGTAGWLSNKLGS